ncbi:disease resistance protein RPP5-like [Neltuma alba]|uniref:disease resistance protein RPP5-like n=1 Tax=Neltuma alba TaxID=207710 RepID=UPI0010A50336|nr:disease resistance protein RPP5-like [Prosopis alba]
MKEDESLQLFSNKAFSEDYPPNEDYLKLSEFVVEYAGGLPLALKALGSFLCGRSKAEWIDALDRLKQIPDNDILQVLKISYDGLTNEEEKTIFLDIACLFKGWQKKYVTQILESCGLHATIGINVLIQKTLLVETKNCRLEMHDLLQELGRTIVQQESPNDVRKRSRLWKFEDIKEVLENNEGSEAIEAIVIRDRYYHMPDKIKVHPEAFLKMSNIRLLFINLMGDNLFIFTRGLKFFAGGLKVVQWPSFPLEALPLETPLYKLVDIQMPESKIKQLWNDIQFMTKLKYINLSYSHDFTETPDFSGVPYLEHLHLSGCKSLVKVHSSLGQLKGLIEVYLDGCGNLEILPEKLETNSLMKFDLSGCKKVAVLPEFGEGMKKLSYLNVSDTAITTLPESPGNKLLKTGITRQISCFNVTSLIELYLSLCGLNDGSIPDGFGNLSSLIVLDLRGNHFVNLPTNCFSGLSRLLFLSFDHCTSLKSLPRFPPQ